MSTTDRFPRRAERARLTRRRVVTAAMALFLERGYDGTSIAVIAERADVAEQTVYAAFGTKRAVLMAAVDMAIAGDDRPIVVNDRDWMQAVWDAPDPASRLRAYAAAVRRILDGAARVFAVLEVAAHSDDELAEQWRETLRRRRKGVAGVVGPIADDGALRAGLSRDDAIDVVWALNGHEVYLNLVDRRRWSPSRYEQWLGDAFVRLLLPDAPVAHRRTAGTTQ